MSKPVILDLDRVAYLSPDRNEKPSKRAVRKLRNDLRDTFFAGFTADMVPHVLRGEQVKQ